MFNNKWFTLIELVVALFVSIIAMSWFVFFFANVSSTVISISNQSDSAKSLNEFNWELNTILKNYPNPKKIFDSVEFNNKEWFSLLLMTNSDDSEWVIIGVYDWDNNEIVSWAGYYYSNFHPFYSFVAWSDLTNIISATTSSSAISNIDIDWIKYFDSVFLYKMWINSINSGSNVKLDLIFTNYYEREFEDLDIIDLFDNEDVSYFTVSLIK